MYDTGFTTIGAGAFGGGGAANWPFGNISAPPGSGGSAPRGGGGGSTPFGDTSQGFDRSLEEKKREFDAQQALQQQQLAFQQGKFGSVFGYLQGLGNAFGLGGGGGGVPVSGQNYLPGVSGGSPARPGAGGGAFPGAFYTGGGPVGQQPRIDSGPVWNDAQVQQQVNAARATNDASTASQIRQQQQSAAGRGFGGQSPLLLELQGRAQAANLAANADAERGIRLDAAQANAGQRLKGQQAAEQQYASRQQEDISRRQPYVTGYFNTRNALLGALAGLA